MTQLLVMAVLVGQIDRNEDEMFGSAPAAADAGTTERARPNEDAMFGGHTTSAAPALADGGVDIDAQQLGGPALKNLFDTEEQKVNPLTIGGTLYLRTQASLLEHTYLKN